MPDINKLSKDEQIALSDFWKHPIAAYKSLNKVERKMLWKHPILSLKMPRLIQEAYSAADKKFPPPQQADGKIYNAYLHCYWAASIMKASNPKVALEVTSAHEDFDSNAKMGSFNNKVGIDMSASHPLWSSQEVADYCLIWGLLALSPDDEKLKGWNNGSY